MPVRLKAAKLEFTHPVTGTTRKTLTGNILSIDIREVARNAADDATFEIAHDFADIDQLVPGDEVKVYVEADHDRQTGDFDATFTPSSGSNANWVEVAVTGNESIDKVEARVDEGAWEELPLQAWGNYAKGISAPEGSIVEFRATSADGDQDYSTGYVWTGLDPVPDLTHIWTGVFDERASGREDPDYSVVTLTAQDWVTYKLAHTYISSTWQDMTVGAILKNALTESIPEIGQDYIEDTGTTLDSFKANDESLLSLVRRLAERANAEFRGDKAKNLHFFERGTKASGQTVGPGTVVRGTFDARQTLDGFGNSILIRGGMRSLLDNENVNAHDSYILVDDSTYHKVRVEVSKDRLAAVSLYTNPDPGGGGGSLTVRIQADNSAGTAPIAEGDPDYDIATRTIEEADLEDPGWTEFRFDENVLPAGGHVWIIVQANEKGQWVSQDSSGDLRYKTYIDVPIITRVEDSASIAARGRVSMRPYSDRNIRTDADAKTVGAAIIAAHKSPPIVGSYQCIEMSLAHVVIGQTVTATFAKDGIAAGTELIVTSKHHQYDAETGLYTLTHEFSDTEEPLTPGEIVAQLAARIKSLEDKDHDIPFASAFRSISDTATVADSVSATGDEGGNSKIGTAKIGFSLITQFEGIELTVEFVSNDFFTATDDADYNDGVFIGGHIQAGDLRVESGGSTTYLDETYELVAAGDGETRTVKLWDLASYVSGRPHSGGSSGTTDINVKNGAEDYKEARAILVENDFFNTSDASNFSNRVLVSEDATTISALSQPQCDATEVSPLYELTAAGDGDTGKVRVFDLEGYTDDTPLTEGAQSRRAYYYKVLT